MKLKLLCVAIGVMAFLQTVQAQPYVPFLNNSTWNVATASWSGVTNSVINTGTDVVIGSFTYRKITDPIYSTDVYLREDVAAKKVYRHVNNADELLYDFSLPVSGTFTTSFGSVYTVISITDVNVNGGVRRRFQLDNGFFGFTWIEGVGSPNHPLVPYYELPTDPYIYLTCSAQNGSAVYNHGIANGNTPTDCAMLLDTTDHNAIAQKVYFSPNPFATAMTINSTINLDNTLLTVYNSLGQKVKEIFYTDGQHLVFNRGNLSNGIYFLQLSRSGEVIVNKKIVIRD